MLVLAAALGVPAKQKPKALAANHRGEDEHTKHQGEHEHKLKQEAAETKVSSSTTPPNIAHA